LVVNVADGHFDHFDGTDNLHYTDGAGCVRVAIGQIERLAYEGGFTSSAVTDDGDIDLESCVVKDTLTYALDLIGANAKSIVRRV